MGGITRGIQINIALHVNGTPLTSQQGAAFVGALTPEQVTTVVQALSPETSRC
ncbi:hypothetical protein [Deinococcus sp. QL22]|uniref:hypothetical protein n=1 Tax=Deinococcus sp. QL22 TaxID=2939437 RepID=UPI002017850C|nr:hypothetical protein [Deinococcus sp. QL22]UQN06485.1 hypothetical protein M1R55_00780 [Deinococcus sp. QL22]